MENQSVEERTNSLMNKTKKQLVEIILRKDDVHHKLNDTIKDMTSHLNILTEDKIKDNKLIQELKTEKIKFCTENSELNKTIETLNEEIKEINEVLEDSRRNYHILELDNESYKEEIDNLTDKITFNDIQTNKLVKSYSFYACIMFLLGIIIGICI